MSAERLVGKRLTRWLVARLQYDEGRAAALVREHGARRILDVLYDHVVEWQQWSSREPARGSYRLKRTDRWDREIRNHAAYLTWHINQRRAT